MLDPELLGTESGEIILNVKEPVLVRYQDCDYVGQDPCTRKFTVREQLYPEVRGWIEHEFETEGEALRFLEGLRLGAD